MVGNFVHLGFEQTADEVRVAAGKDDFRAAAFVFDGEHVATDAVADVVVLALHAFAVRHDALELAEVDHHVVALEAADGAGNHVAGAVLEFLVNHFLLRLAEALHHRLLGGLHGDAAEILGRDVEFLDLADLGFRVFLDRCGKGDFVEFVRVVLIGHHGEQGKNPGFALLGVHLGTQRFDGIGAGNHLAVGGNEGELQRGDDLVSVDAFFLFVILNEGDDIVGHNWRCLRSRC